MTEWKIYGRYRGEKAEEIDRADTRREAEYLVREHCLAFGSDWQVLKRFGKAD